jgi:CBS domain containing-hemolysin-like protein
MIAISDVFMLSDSILLHRDVLENIWNSGFSRIPVFHRRDRQHITGYLLVKSLVTVSSK